MAKISLCALVYTNVDGQKVRRKALTVFDDAMKADIEMWQGKGQVRDATVGEIAEAVAAGHMDPKALPKPPSTKKADTATAAKSETAVAKVETDKAAGNANAAQQSTDGATKRQDLV